MDGPDLGDDLKVIELFEGSSVFRKLKSRTKLPAAFLQIMIEHAPPNCNLRNLHIRLIRF